MTHLKEIEHAREQLNFWYERDDVPVMHPTVSDADAKLRRFATYWAEFADAHPRQAEKFLAVRAVTLELSSKIDRTPI